MPRCEYDPRVMSGLPIGMFHCPECGEMVLAGLPHPPPDDEVDWSGFHPAPFQDD